jgi:hypothetical protein
MPKLAPPNRDYADLLEHSGEAVRELIRNCPSVSRVQASPPFRHNPSFETGDVEPYFAMIEKFRPESIIEVGVGYSSHVAAMALAGNPKSRLQLIDPDPRCPVPGSADLLQMLVQDAPLTMFEALKEGDILFIDSSHTAEECRYHCETILPRLAPGVLVHYHDILYPYEPRHQEEAVILDYMLDHLDQFEVLFGLAQAWHDGGLNSVIPEHLLNQARVPSSMWMRKI